MILSEVIMGTVAKMFVGDETLRRVSIEHVRVAPNYVLTMLILKPPEGCDSVVGEPGGDLNYDESVGTSSITPVYSHCS